jgi:hypothetical protein
VLTLKEAVRFSKPGDPRGRRTWDVVETLDGGMDTTAKRDRPFRLIVTDRSKGT